MICLVVRSTPQCIPSSFMLFFHGAGCPELGKYCIGSCIVRAVREVGKFRLGPAAPGKVPSLLMCIGVSVSYTSRAPNVTRVCWPVHSQSTTLPSNPSRTCAVWSALDRENQGQDSPSRQPSELGEFGPQTHHREILCSLLDGTSKLDKDSYQPQGRHNASLTQGMLHRSVGSSHSRSDCNTPTVQNGITRQ